MSRPAVRVARTAPAAVLRERPVPPPLRVGRVVSLRPVVPDDYPFLYWLSTHEELTFRWRFAGRLPSFET